MGFDFRKFVQRFWSIPIPAVVIFSIYMLFSVQQWQSYYSPVYDLAIFEQAVSKYASFEPPFSTIKDMIILGDHFSPIIILAVPFYWLIPNGFSLILLQNLLFAISASVVGYIGYSKVNRIFGVLVGLAFGFSFGIEYAVFVQFHEIAFGVLIIAISLFYYSKQSNNASAIWMSSLVFVKEELCLIVILYGLILWAVTKNGKNLLLSVWGLAWAVLEFAVIIPAFNPSGTSLYLGQIDFGVLFGNFFDPSQLLIVFLILISGGVIFVFSPITLLVLPEIIARFVTGRSDYYWHHDAISMPVIYIAFIFVISGIASSKKWKERFHRGYKRIAKRFAIYSGICVMVVSLGVSLFLGYRFTPLHILLFDGPSTDTTFLDWETNQVRQSEHYFNFSRGEYFKKVLEVIPENSSVMTSGDVMTYLLPNRVLFPRPGGNGLAVASETHNPDYFLVTNYGREFMLQVSEHISQTVPQAIASYFMPDIDWEEIFNDGVYAVLKPK
ncbi:MAG: DUF2079 domain-containing protein, partial [Bifidobacteriaceae bacterium]|nr:DUF2079 domain-containing protein [Bifidobacteriaceae bacterium]